MMKDAKKIVPNPERGQRGDFGKLTITMPPEMIDALEDVRRQRKKAKEKNSDMSSLIREAVSEWLVNKKKKA